MFLTYPRWDILELIAKKPASPVEISEKLGTTVSYISQQLKLLYAAGLLVKEKTGAVEKGKPRSLFRLSKEFVFFGVLINGFFEKKIINIKDHHKAILKIWSIEDEDSHYYFEKLFWKLQDDLKDLDGIFLDLKSSPKMIIVSKSKTLRQKLNVFTKEFDKKIDYSVVLSLGKGDFSKKIVSLYDPRFILDAIKGGGVSRDD